MSSLRMSSLRQRRLRRTISFGAVLALAAAWFFLLGPGAGTPLPSLVGLNRTEAEATVASLGFSLEVDEELFDEQVPAGTILATNPGAGRRLKAGATIQVVLSKGPERYVVPDLIGLTVDQADAALANLNLLLGERGDAFSDTVPEGRIISTTPAAGTQTRGGSIVNIVVSKGQELLVLADVSGVDGDQAMVELRDAGFAPTTTLAFSETVAEGSVISQTPVPGNYPRGTAVTLTISMGSELVSVPMVKGLSLLDAAKLLENAGLTLTPIAPLTATVTAQSIAAGTMVKRGTQVVLTLKKR